MSRALVSVPTTARRGEVIEIRAMAAHLMETGHRTDATGTTIPRNIIHRFVCTYDGDEIFSAVLFPAIAANPFLAFTTTATTSGVIAFSWFGDDGSVQQATAEITVT
ncbi:thiosulfate oxidation carrier complex protein SoxZ [Chelatococcus reniformis]|uniref:Thiosulfate oxidation carrier complex protein SoxZ n=1 Tax=Chelatococcus reniformis TaxID=1494448 RepID=A0A916UU78_9HYPH|nr:thiosulfate oxidation carrier complex protein SoxZ [Chelatococcus reniformis]GGC88698.1 thiosulfate oxidation carrier complex protein SoxZ [Chelatococcus reniformis]